MSLNITTHTWVNSPPSVWLMKIDALLGRHLALKIGNDGLNNSRGFMLIETAATDRF